MTAEAKPGVVGTDVNRLTVSCETCGAPILRENAQSRRQWMKRRYCSSACYGKAHTRTVDRRCPICGGTFTIVGTHAHSMRYCSDACRREVALRSRLKWPSLLKLPDDYWPIPYLAGLVDGEGTIAPGSTSSTIRVVNTDRGMMDWIQATFGGTIEVEKRAHKNRKTLYRWRLSRMQDVYILLKLIRPYLTVKRKMAEDTMMVLHERLLKHSYPCGDLGLMPEKPMMLNVGDVEAIYLV